LQPARVVLVVAECFATDKCPARERRSQRIPDSNAKQSSPKLVLKKLFIHATATVAFREGFRVYGEEYNNDPPRTVLVYTVPAVKNRSGDASDASFLLPGSFL
jgi:hypothetical protein